MNNDSSINVAVSRFILIIPCRGDRLGAAS